jgi:hypothetical protein
MFVCTVPRNTDEFSKLHNIEQRLFGDLALPLDVACDIFETRPEIFNAVLDRNGTVVAYTSAFPLRPEWGIALTHGNITGAELRPSMIYKRRDCETDMHLFIGSIVVDPKYDPIQKCILLSSLLWFRVHQLRSTSVQRLSAIMTTASGQGERMARRLGAKKLTDGAKCRDGLDVFGCDISLDLLARAFGVMERFPFGKGVLMNLDFPSCVDANSGPVGIEMPHDRQPLAA